MTLEDFLPLLHNVHQRGKRFTATCPSHADETPSLSVSSGESGVLLRCFAGCDIQNITASLGLSLQDLFYDAPSQDCPTVVRQVSRKARPRTWREFAGELDNEALGLWLRGTDVLDAARGLNTAEWTDGDFERAMETVCGARVDLARAELFGEIAFNLRSGGLRKEREDERRRSQA